VTPPSPIAGFAVKELHVIPDDRGRLFEVCCVAGMIKLVLVDDRPGSPSHGRVEALWLGVHKPRLVVVPPGVWHGWTCTSVEEAMVLNLATEPYDHHAPDEERLAPHGTLPYDWARRDG
jgi:dTDP-4-dehydrorhamnose 3,5-epimerase